VDLREQELNEKRSELETQHRGKEARFSRARDKDGNPLLLFASWSGNAAAPGQTDLYISAFYDKSGDLQVRWTTSCAS
jgi:hypothetical protein